VETLRGALVDAVSVVLVGLRLAVVHLPTLLVVFLLGAGIRGGVLWASVELSDSHHTLAGLLLPLAPMATLTAIIVMLRHVSVALPWASFADGVDEQSRTARHLSLLASTLIPFLTVYAAQGYLKEDLRAFVNAAAYDEIFGQADVFYGGSADIDRTIIADGTLMVALVAVALVLRFLIGRFDLPARHVAFGIVAAYVEVLWLFLLASQLTRYQATAWQWVEDRRFVEWVDDRWAALLDVVGPLSRPLEAVAGAVGSFLTDADAVVLIPIAWLTVGAVALGQKIEHPPRERRDTRWSSRVERVPPVVRRVGSEATADLRGRFSGLANGLRLLAVGGLLPMLLFCLVFVVARQAGALTVEVWRLVVGPTSRDTAIAFGAYLDLLRDGVYTIALVGLLAAAVDRVVSRPAAHRSAAGTTTLAPSPASHRRP
jgi:hypothetical protein